MSLQSIRLPSVDCPHDTPFHAGSKAISWCPNVAIDDAASANPSAVDSLPAPSLSLVPHHDLRLVVSDVVV